MDLVGKGGAQGATGPGAKGAMIALRANIEANTTLPDQVKKALITFVDSSPHPENVRKNIENWFDSSMDRVSGFYKRRSQLIIMVMGFLLSVGMNVNSITLVRALSTDRAMRDSLVAAAQEYARSNPPPANPASSPAPAAGGSATGNKPASTSASTPASTPKPTATPTPAASPTAPASNETAGTNSEDACKTDDTPESRICRNMAEIKKLELPIGWSAQARKDFSDHFPGSLLLGLIGWLITALALSLGAPFWFDLLNKFMVVRATVKPKEKSPEEASKD
jgi:hypothetical protein